MSKTANWTRENIIWLAGLLEGEGCFYLRKQRAGNGRSVPTISLEMTDRDVVERAKWIAGVGGAIGTKDRSNRPFNAKPIHHWIVQSQWEAAALMYAVFPWLGERRQAKIREVLRLWSEQRDGYLPRAA